MKTKIENWFPFFVGKTRKKEPRVKKYSTTMTNLTFAIDSKTIRTCPFSTFDIIIMRSIRHWRYHDWMRKKNQIQAFYLPEIFFVSEINFSNNNVNIIFYHFMLFFDRIENLNLTINDCIRFVTMMMMMMIIIIHHWLNVIFKRSLIIEILSRIDKFFFVLFCFFIFLFEFF